jgi:hypothetical protein
MKNNLLILFCIFSVQLIAQRRPNLNTINRKVNLYKNSYHNDYSASFTSGVLVFRGDLKETTENQSTNETITINKRFKNNLSLCTKVSFGELYGQGILYDWDYDMTSNYKFNNSFSAYSLLIKRQINNTKSSTRFNTAIGLGVITSKVKSIPNNTILPTFNSNFNTLFIPITLDFEYFFTSHFGITIASELNYCFSDKMDQAAEFIDEVQIKNLKKMDVFTSYTAGICIKLE